MHDLNGKERDLLYLAHALDEPSGREMKAELEEFYNAVYSDMEIYGSLDNLHDKELVRRETEQGSRENTYRVTRRGLREIQDRIKWEREVLSD